MTRRGLLGMLAAAALDPDRALWIPSAKRFFIPPPRLPVSGIAIQRAGDFVRVREPMRFIAMTGRQYQPMPFTEHHIFYIVGDDGSLTRVVRG